MRHTTGRIALQRLQQRPAQWPLAVTRVDVDVPGVLHVHELAAPGSRIGACQADGTEGVVAAGHHDAATGRRRKGHRGKVTQNGAALRVGRGHQQRAAHAGRCLGAHVGGGNAAQAVRHDDHGVRSGQHGFFELPNPGQPRGRTQSSCTTRRALGRRSAQRL